jgi:hypothetical protein
MAGISEPTHAELARLVGAARAAGGVSRGSNLRLTIAVAAFLAILSIIPHATRGRTFLSSPIVGAVSPAPSIGRPPEESPAMRAAGLAVVVSVGVVSGVVNAQDAVQWRVEDGGNGHWYGVGLRESVISWTDARAAAELLGGHLATVTTEPESTFVFSVCNAPEVWPSWGSPYPSFRLGPWLGGFQDRDAPDYQSPSTGWRWVTGEEWAFTNWRTGQPDGPNDEDRLMLYCGVSICPTWNNASVAGAYGDGIRSFVIEWSSDCNADGIVDYGQILAGEIDDANGNNIPDCCENGVPCDPCAAADLDASGAVNGVDLAIILNTWGTGGGKYPQADIDGDGVVGGADLALVLGAWGECP